MSVTIVNQRGARLTGELKCWMGRRVVETETPDGRRHIGTLHVDGTPATLPRRRVSTVEG